MSVLLAGANPERVRAQQLEEIKKMENGTAMVKDDTKKSSEIQTVHNLDKAVREVHDLKTKGAVLSWQLGKKIKEIADQQLWKLRTTRDASGKEVSQHKSVDLFFEAELGIGRQHAYKLMDVARAYSEREVAQHGTTKLALLLSLPEAELKAEKEKIAAGGTLPSVREIKKMTKEVKEKTGHVAPTRSGKPDRLVKARAAKVADPKKVKITTVALEGTQKVKLYKSDASPAKLATIDWSTLSRSKRAADRPVGMLELSNHAKMYFQLVQNAAGELEMKVWALRDE